MQEATTANNGANLYAALAAAQGEFQPIEKNRSVTIRPREGAPYSFRYADLEEIISKTRPALTKHKLALFQSLDVSGNDARLVCTLAHAEGAVIQSAISIAHPHSMKEPKQFGALVSYYRRYMVTSILGVAADDDLDEDGQEGQPTTGQQTSQPTGQKPAVTQPQRRPAPAKPEQAGDSPAATQGEVAYITKKIEGAGLTIAQAREKAGIAAGDTLEGITKADFAALKVVL